MICGSKLILINNGDMRHAHFLIYLYVSLAQAMHKHNNN